MYKSTSVRRNKEYNLKNCDPSLSGLPNRREARPRCTCLNPCQLPISCMHNSGPYQGDYPQRVGHAEQKRVKYCSPQRTGAPLHSLLKLQLKSCFRDQGLVPVLSILTSVIHNFCADLPNPLTVLAFPQFTLSSPKASLFSHFPTPLLQHRLKQEYPCPRPLLECQSHRLAALPRYPLNPPLCCFDL